MDFAVVRITRCEVNVLLEVINAQLAQSYLQQSATEQFTVIGQSDKLLPNTVRTNLVSMTPSFKD